MFARLTVLLAAAGFFCWVGVVLAARAFEPHPDSQPWFYVMTGGMPIALSLVMLGLAVRVFRKLREGR